MKQERYRSVEYGVYSVITEVLDRLVRDGGAELVATPGESWTFPIVKGSQIQLDKYGRATGEAIEGSERILCNYFTVRINSKLLSLQSTSFPEFEGLRIYDKTSGDKAIKESNVYKVPFDPDNRVLSIELAYNTIIKLGTGKAV